MSQFTACLEQQTVPPLADHLLRLAGELPGWLERILRGLTRHERL